MSDGEGQSGSRYLELELFDEREDQVGRVGLRSIGPILQRTDQPAAPVVEGAVALSTRHLLRWSRRLICSVRKGDQGVREAFWLG